MTFTLQPGTEGGSIGILAALHSVMAESHGVEKKGQLAITSTSKMSFMKIDDIVMEYRPLLIKHGILTVPHLVSSTVYRDHADDEWTSGAPTANPPIPSRQVFNGTVRKLRVHIVVEVETKFICVADGSSIVVRTPGEAMDTQDKATRKAMTSAKKIAFIDLFQVITGDPEEDDDVEGRLNAKADADRPNRQEQKVARAKEGHGTTAAPEREQDERAPIASDETDSEDKAKALLRDYAKEHKVPVAKLLEFGESVMDGRPRKEWVGKITFVKKVLAAAEEGLAGFKGEGE